jgi:hypothetical protein
VLELRTELLDLGFERGNFGAQDARALGKGIGFFPEDSHTDAHL